MNKKAHLKIPLLFIILGLIALSFTIYIGYRIGISDRRLIPINVIALIAGVLFEGRRLSDKRAPLLRTALSAFVISFVTFLPGKQEHNYSFDNHIEMWPYSFILIFILFSIVSHGDKVVRKLTEGITLLQSVAVIYWVADYGFLDTESWFLQSLMVIGLVFSIYTLFHAFTNVTLSRTSRFTLSIWSSIIMMLFAIDNIYRVYQNEQIENTANLAQGLFIGLQFFLLGVSSIYIVQNFIMLAGFMPGKGTFFNAQYFREVQELKNDHIKRYSDRQVSIVHSFLCVLFSGAVFALNYHYQILPRHTTIWMVFVIFPFVLMALGYVQGGKATENSRLPQ